MKQKIKYLLPISLLLLIILSVVINYYGFMQGVDWGCDFAGYVIQAQTLASGDFAALKYNIGRNDFVLNYPWGFPMLLLPVIENFETDLIAIKKYIYLYFLASLILVYLLFHREKVQSLIIALLMSASPFFWNFKNHIFSDFPNLFFTLLALLLMDHLVVRRKKIIEPFTDHSLLGITIFAACFIRTQSLVLLLTLLPLQIIYLKKELLDKKILQPSVLPYAVCLALKFVFSQSIPVKEVSYMGMYDGMNWWTTFSGNLFYYLKVWRELFGENPIVTGAGVLFCFVGFVTNWRANLLYILFIVFFISMLLFTPFHQGLRYVMPLIPFFFYFMVKGLYVSCSKLFKRWDLRITYTLLALLISWSLFTIAIMSASNLKHKPIIEGPYSASSVKLFNFLKDSTAKQSIIAYWKPRVMLLYSGRNSIVPRNYNECIDRGASYYVYYRKAYCDQMPLDSITSSPERFKVVYGNADFKVFEVLNTTFKSQEGADLTPPSGASLVKTIDHNFFDASLLCCEPDKLIGIWSNGPVMAKEFKLSAGKYILSVYSKGTKAGNEFPLNKVILNDDTIGTFYGKAELAREDFSFELNSDKMVKLAMKMNNDLLLKETNEDRNTLLYFINIYRLAK